MPEQQRMRKAMSPWDLSTHADKAQGSCLRSASESRVQRAQREHVRDVLRPAPGAARYVDAVAEVAELVHVVRVAADHEAGAGIARGARVHVIEIETLGLGVDLEHDAGRCGHGDHAFEIDGDRRALAEQSTRRVREHVDMAVADRAHDALGHRLAPPGLRGAVGEALPMPGSSASDSPSHATTSATRLGMAYIVRAALR